MKTKPSKIIALVLAAFFAVAVFATAAPAVSVKVATAEEEGYGAKKPVATMKEAKAALEEYYKGKDVMVGTLKEKELYFEAELLDKNGKVVDRVIIDKRTGRIRSIY